MTCTCTILSDLHASSVCINSFFDVFFDLIEAAHVVLCFNGSDYTADFSAGDDLFFHVQAPDTAGDYLAVVKATVSDCCCNNVHQITITVKDPATVDAGCDRTIPLGSSTEIGVGPALSDVIYTWLPADGISDVNAFPTIATPTSDITYTVIAQRTDVSDCVASDSVTINICKLWLSDVQFHPFATDIFSVTGYQFADEPGTRFVSVEYVDTPTQTQNFNTDGFFLFPFIYMPISDGAPITVTAYSCDCASDMWVLPSFLFPIEQGILAALYVASLLEFTLTLPPELAVQLPITSDIFEIYSDICSFADDQDCQRFLAGLTITNQSDVFCSDALILKQPEVVFVFCSDNVIHMDDAEGDFTFSITNFLSDAVTVTYSDANCGLISKDMNLSDGGFNLHISDENFLWIDPCSSDSLDIFANIFTHPLLVIDAASTITDVESIECAPLCHTPTNDPDQVCFFKASAIKLGDYLEEHFPSDYPDNIDHACHVLYTGPVTAQVVTVDLENCELIFSGFKFPCSDIDVCSGS